MTAREMIEELIKYPPDTCLQFVHWIPVEEALPEPMTKVIVSTESGDVHTASRLPMYQGEQIVSYVGDENGFIDGKWDRVVAWMHFPPSYDV